MNSFKEILKADVKTVFINPLEFAEPHNINGKIIDITIDQNEMIEREKRYKNSSDDGLHAKQILLYVTREDFGILPAAGRMLTLDGERYKVTDAINESDIYSISLEANQT